MPAPHFPNSSHRCVLTRVASDEEIESLRARLFELKCRDVVFLVDCDDGSVWSCTVGTGSYVASVTVNRWNPAKPSVIQISGLTATAVARIVSRIWPGELHVEALLEHGASVDDNGAVDQ